MPSRISASNPEPEPSFPACQIALDPTVGLKPNLKIPDCEISFLNKESNVNELFKDRKIQDGVDVRTLVEKL